MSRAFSVVVPTEGRALAIDALVTSLHESWGSHARRTGEHRAPSEVLELVIVDSSEPALDPDTIAAWDPSWMRVERGTRNVREKRNQGATAIRAPWIAFVDSDCLVTPGYVSGVLAAIGSHQALAFAGRVEFRGAENLIWRVVAASPLISPQTQTAGEGAVPWCATANLIVERNLFMSLGGFDQSLPFRLGGDDVDLGLRLQRSGNALIVLPDALVVHPKEPWSKARAILSRTWRWGRIEYHLALRHPEKLRAMPPYYSATALTIGLMCLAGAAITGRLALLWMLPLWVVTSTFLSTTFIGWGTGSALPRHLAGWLERLYHAGCVWEHVRSGSFRFLWMGLLLDDNLAGMFPAEPLQSWSNLLAAFFVALVGASIVGGIR